MECKVSTDEAKMLLNNLMTHISTWFDYVETRTEFEISFEEYKKKLRNAKASLGEHTVMEIETIVKDLNSKHEFLFHYNYIGRCTFGFKGDSICEASFSSLKCKANKNAIHGNAPIHSSTMAMLKVTEKKAKKRRVDLMNDLNREVCWTTAQVANDLTKYALGLFTDHFDKRLQYESSRLGTTEWLVVHQSFGNQSPNETTTFDRVRRVKISEDGFMNCSCGKTGEYLLPCVHICRIIDKDEYFTPVMFLIRWHKLFNFGVHGSHTDGNLKNTREVLKEILFETRNSHYESDGKYKGILLKHSKFLNDMKDIPFLISKRAKFLKHPFEQSRIKPINSGGYTEEQFGSEIPNCATFDTDTMKYNERGSRLLLMFTDRIQHVSISGRHEISNIVCY